MSRLIRLTLCAALTALVAVSLPAAATASPSQLAIVQDDRRLVYSGPGLRSHTLGELRDLGVDVVKFHLDWTAVAPIGRRKPSGFEGWKVEDYDDAKFERYDDLVRKIKAHGMRVLLAPTGPAPGWATKRGGDRAGVWRPSAREYGRFVRALATRYDGKHTDASGEPLPRVRFWTLYNEPNHPLFLQPQSSARRKMNISPHIYREMVRHAVSGLRLAGHRRDSVLFGEILPIGHSRHGAKNTIKPVTFIREFFCLDRRWRPYRGRAARARDCHRFRRLTGVTGFAYHPYTRPSGPRTREPSRRDATIRSLSRIERALDRAARARKVRRGLGIYNTEFGFQSDPPDPFFGARLSRIPAFLNESEYMTYSNRRVKTWSQYALVDDPLRDEPGRARYAGFQTGLYYADGRRKDKIYSAWRMPIFVKLRSRRSVEIWGGVRMPEARGRTIQLQQRRRGQRYRNVRGGRIRIRNYRGYFRKNVRISRPDRRRYRFVYVAPDGEEHTSRSTRAARR